MLFKKIFFQSVISLFLCACGAAQSPQHNDNILPPAPSESDPHSQTIALPKTLVLDLVPYIADHRGGTLKKMAERLFLEQMLPFVDTYVPILDGAELPAELEPWAVDIEGRPFLIVNENSWQVTPDNIKNSILKLNYLNLYAVTAYRVTISGIINDTSKVARKSDMLDEVPTELVKLFNSWSQHASEFTMSNCYHFALAATGLDVGEERTVKTYEFEQLLNSHFKRVETPQTGDLIVMATEDNVTIHAAIFVGLSRHDRQEMIFLSKNGQGKGQAHFMSEKTLRYKAYREAPVVSYWRRK